MIEDCFTMSPKLFSLRVFFTTLRVLFLPNSVYNYFPLFLLIQFFIRFFVYIQTRDQIRNTDYSCFRLWRVSSYTRIIYEIVIINLIDNTRTQQKCEKKSFIRKVPIIIFRCVIRIFYTSK